MQNLTILTELQYVQQMINPKTTRHEQDNRSHARYLPEIIIFEIIVIKIKLNHMFYLPSPSLQGHKRTACAPFETSVNVFKMVLKALLPKNIFACN